MGNLSLVLVLLALAQWSAAFNVHQRRASGGYNSGYTSSSRYSSEPGSSFGNKALCCQLNSWSYEHMEEVREFASRLRQEYNNMSHSSSTGNRNAYATPWSENIMHLTGKTGIELDSLCRRLSEQLVTDMRKGLLSHETIAQRSFFEWKASELLETNNNSDNEFGQQKQLIDVSHYQPIMSNYDEVKNYAYPAEVKEIDGKIYYVHTNCTEAKKTTGDGTFVVKRNRTIVTTNNMPVYMPSYNRNNEFTSSSMFNGASNNYPAAYVQPGVDATNTVRSKQTIYDWVNKNMEPSVMNYKPTVNVDWDASGKLNSYKPLVHIPVTSDVETFSTGSHSYRPSSTVTIRRYNKTITSNSDGINTVTGSEVNKKWVDGKLVYDTQRPFGDRSVPVDEAWKREERERLFWFLTQGENTPQNLEEWQRRQEERLIGLADRYHTTIEVIQEWHRQELERYRVLLQQYQAQQQDQTGWQRIERGRLDWLIHQNSVTLEELKRWQRENQDKLAKLAAQYQISLTELKNWQVEELNRLYVYFNDQNNSMITRPDSDSLHISEQRRLDELIRQHNATIANLQNSIKSDQQKLRDISLKYHGNVEDMEKWLKKELAHLGGVINEQHNEMTRITKWQHDERSRLQEIVTKHQGSVGSLDAQMARDRIYIQSLAAKYHVSIDELDKWQRSELERLQNEGQTKLEMNIKEWQRREREHLKSVIQKNDLTIEEFQLEIMSDRQRLENLAKTYKIQVSEVEEWIKNEIKNLQSQGLLKEVEAELKLWQQKERERLLAFVQQNSLTIEELETKIKQDQSHLYGLANTHQVAVEEIENWLKKELLRLQGEGLIKVEELKDWQKNERDDILKIVQQNKLTIQEFEQKLLSDRQRLADISKTYNVQTSEIETWIKNEGNRLQSLGLLQMQEQLNNWQKIERERLLVLINQNNLSIGELEEKIKKDQVHRYSLAHQHQIQVEEVEEWIKKEIKKLQQEGLIEMEKLKDWQTDWRGNLTNMVKERDFTVEEFHKWLLEDRARLQALAMQHNVQIEEIEQWVHNEEQRFVSMGLLKPNEKLTNWQEVERRYLERITQEQYQSTEQLERRLRLDRELLENLSRDYSIQVEEIEKWMKKELARLRDDGQLQIDNLTSWQIAERERLEKLTQQNKQWSAEEFEKVLHQDREHMQKMAFQYHTSVEEIEKWIQSEVARLQHQGKLNIEKLTAWQKSEHQHILNLLQQQSSITAEEFERKVQHDRNFLTNLANQYHISVVEVEEYVKKVIDELREKGKFQVENLKTWQIVERDYIKQLIGQYKNSLSTAEYEQKLKNDRSHLSQLSEQYHININQIENWMIEELKRLRKNSELQVQNLATWQVDEAQRIKQLIQHNEHISYVEFEVELMKERARLQQLANQYSLSVEQVEEWLRQQLVNLKTTGQVQVDNLNQWQEAEQKRLIEMLLQQQKHISIVEFESQLQRDHARLQQLAAQYSVSVQEIETWMRNELQRLKNSGLVQVEHLNNWQKNERDRLENWLKQQNNGANYDQLNEFLRSDKERLERIAQEYSITAEEVESWVLQEGARLQILSKVQSPEKIVNNVNTIWKEQTRARLISDAYVKPMNLQDFDRFLSEHRMQWQKDAREHNITVEEIEMWLREVAQDLQKQGLIKGTVTVEEWQVTENRHIQKLIHEKLRKQQQWSIEELERKLQQDRQYLQQLATQHHIAVIEIETWYKQELQRLLSQRKIVTENLKDWQRREKDRIYGIVSQQFMTVQQLEEILLKDQKTLNELADKYHVAIEELKIWILNELKRLANLGLVHDLNTQTTGWQQQERDRLRTIAAEITISEEELLEFIRTDNSYQDKLAKIYGCSLEQLVPFQRVEVNDMKLEGLLDNTTLLGVEPWQKYERDQLYSFIKNQNLSLQNLSPWQRQEYERLQQLAKLYKMNLKQLQEFRENQLLYMVNVMHKKTSNEQERFDFGIKEHNLMDSLKTTTHLTDEELLVWRRRLYLLSQGRLPMDVGGYGGYETGIGSTNRTATPQQAISKDRGDQPPNVYDEKVDAEEPGVAGQNDSLYPLPLAQYRDQPAKQETAPGGRQIGYRYTKKESKFTVPIDGNFASASATADSNSASSGAIVYGHTGVNSNFNGMESHALTMDGYGQQQQQVEAEDVGQQQQEDLGWNEKLIAHGNDNGQQQVQVEDLTGTFTDQRGHGANTFSTHGGYSSGRFDTQQQQQVEDFGQQQQVELGDYKQHENDQQQQVQVEDLRGTTFMTSHHGASQKQVEGTAATPSNPQIEVTAEAEPNGFWNKLKKKTGNIFG